jgi:hypothetical protein
MKNLALLSIKSNCCYIYYAAGVSPLSKPTCTCPWLLFKIISPATKRGFLVKYKKNRLRGSGAESAENKKLFSG